MIHLDLRYIEFAMHRVQYAVFLQIESPTCIIGPWFFVHK